MGPNEGLNRIPDFNYFTFDMNCTHVSINLFLGVQTDCFMISLPPEFTKQIYSKQKKILKN